MCVNTYLLRPCASNINESDRLLRQQSKRANVWKRLWNLSDSVQVQLASRYVSCTFHHSGLGLSSSRNDRNTAEQVHFGTELPRYLDLLVRELRQSHHLGLGGCGGQEKTRLLRRMFSLLNSDRRPEGLGRHDPSDPMGRRGGTARNAPKCQNRGAICSKFASQFPHPASPGLAGFPSHERSNSSVSA